MNLSDGWLAGWYRRYNERYFAGDLPDEVDVLYAPVKGCCADVLPGELDDFVLRINPAFALDASIARITLLHEMVHIKLWPNRRHGAAFYEEIKRLAQAGAYKGIL